MHLLSAIAALFLNSAWGQAPTDAPEVAPEATQPAGPRLPTVAYAAPAPYPPDALAAGTEGRVLLDLIVDETGAVVEAAVLESTDPRFDGPALQAIAGYAFTPALDATGTPSPARIQYAIGFTVAAAPVLSVDGQVVDSADGPVPGVEIELVDAAGAPVRATTDDQGVFRFADLAPGPYTLTALPPTDALDREILPVEVQDGVVVQPVVRLADASRSTGTADLTIEVSARRQTSEITERVLTADEALFLPGTNGDIVKVVQNLPGVARPPLGIGQLIIRGTAPEDSAYYLDGGQIPLVFHFSGLTTVLNGDSLSEVAFLPSNYSVRYGRTIGGVVELRTDPERPEVDRTYASVDVYQATAFTERAVGRNGTLTLSGRRSYVDAVLSPVLSNSEFTVQAPRYYDVQGRYQMDGDDGGRWDLLFFASDDRFRFIGSDEQGQDETLAALNTSFQKARLRYQRDLGDGWTQDAVLVAGPEVQGFEFEGNAEAEERDLGANLRVELTRPTTETRDVGLRGGIDVYGGQQSFLYDLPDLNTPYEAGDSLVLMPGAYAETTLRLGRSDKVDIIPGIRGDGMLLENGTALWTADPRLAMRYRVLPYTTLKAGTGLFSQFPSARQLIPEGDGNADLDVERAWQSSFGVEQQILGDLRAEVTGFYSELSQLVVGREDRFYFYSGPPPEGPFDTDPYGNEGTGLVCGVESQVRYDSPRMVALFSLTLSHSERTGRLSDDAQLFTYDQPVVLNALASRSFESRARRTAGNARSADWRLGARVRYGSGNPYTPVVNRILASDTQTWLPVYANEGSRLDSFFSLDVRLDKDWEFDDWTLTTYLDLQNATYARNVEVMAYSEDYSAQEPIEGLPPLPAFGFKGEW